MQEIRKVGFSGSRRWPDSMSYILQKTAEEEFEDADGDILFKFGDCPTGVDKIIHTFVMDNSLPYRRFEADWVKYGNAAGPIRNREMIDSGLNKLYAFPDEHSKGTIDCLKYAESKGIEVQTLYLENWPGQLSWRAARKGRLHVQSGN